MDLAIGYDGTVKAKIAQNAEQGRRTLLLCFYAGHGVTFNTMTSALTNSSELPDEFGMGGNQFMMEFWLKELAE